MTELLSEILKGSEINKLIKNANIVLLWSECVPREIAKNTEAIKIRNKVLYVDAKTSVWAQELNFLKKEILEKINEIAGFKAVADIRFKAGGNGNDKRKI
ncbi:MAG: hypothetical protein FD145_293 [Candidatus Saganbacteria bacterium]|uniref:DUF721 domain-containing protein n=1 Tax=Candidatus Saganbacteria bacterium TaxID=2575572 RepID=A0A833L228_UNCSA|nr:MAG: hypothetical protein FD145_293 [Candidatus Saganbacteria bacterium]